MEFSSPTLTAFQYADKSLLYFPINFMEVSILGFQTYRNLCMPRDTELFVQRLSVEQNIIKYSPTCLNLNSIGAKSRRFDNQQLTMQCSDHDDLIPSRINKLVSITTKIIPRWLGHENRLRSVLIGLCFIVSAILFNTCLVVRNMTLMNRARFVLSSALRAETILSGLVGELRHWHNLEWIYRGKILPPTHPTRIRVELIFGEIINALNIGLKLEDDKRMTVSGDPKIGNNIARNNYYSDQVMMREDVFNRLAQLYSSSHLVGHSWKLAIVDRGLCKAYYIRGLRRIVLTTDIIEYYCNSEADIAAILGHEVGHGVCSISESDLLKLVTFVMCCNFNFNISFVPFLVSLKCFNIGEELVADYIGLMLMASAGYDPRAFPLLIERMTGDNAAGDNKVFQPRRRRGVNYYMKKLMQVIKYLIKPAYPSCKTRIRSLERVMGEAVTIYEQVRGAERPTHVDRGGQEELC